MINPKFNPGDYVLIKIDNHVARYHEMWVVRIKSITQDYYILEDVTSQVAFTCKWPLQFDNFMYKIEDKDVQSTIKMVKVLYHENQ